MKTYGDTAPHVLNADTVCSFTHRPFYPLDKEPTVFVLQETGQQRGAKEETALPLRQPAISKLRCPHVLYSTAVKFTGERLDGFCQLKDDGSSKIMKLNRARPFEIARAKVPKPRRRLIMNTRTQFFYMVRRIS